MFGARAADVTILLACEMVLYFLSFSRRISFDDDDDDDDDDIDLRRDSGTADKKLHETLIWATLCLFSQSIVLTLSCSR
jgi:hypothetical protein